MSKDFSRQFYNSKEWKNKRDIIFNKAYGLCEYCGAVGLEVHHKIHLTPLNINDTYITLDEDNLILLCKDCHFAQHKSSSFKRTYYKRIVNNWTYFTNEGDIMQVEIKIVWGAPCSGKTTYVKNNMTMGDTVICLDSILNCFSYGMGDPKTNSIDNLLPLGYEVRDYIYKLIEDRSKTINSKTIYIIAMLPDRDKREELARRLDAELIHIDTDIQTCIQYLMHDDTRTDKEYQRTMIINYFERFKK